MDVMVTSNTSADPFPSSSQEVNETTSVATETSEENTPFAAISITILSVVIIFCNFLFFIFYLIFGVRTVHSLLVISLCIGNSVMGCSTLLGTVHFLKSITIPYICTTSVATVTWGLAFNIFMTFWICLERYLTIQNILTKGVVWMEKRKELVVMTTAVVIAVYVALLFTVVQDNTAVICDGINVFRHYYPLYGGLNSVLYLCLLFLIVIVYRKTLYKLSLMQKNRHTPQRTKTPVLFLKRSNTTTLPFVSEHSVTTDTIGAVPSNPKRNSVQATNHIPPSSDITTSVEDTHLDEIISEVDDVPIRKLSGIHLDLWTKPDPGDCNIGGIDINPETKTSRSESKVRKTSQISSNNGPVLREENKDSEDIGVSWISTAQTTVRVVICLVSVQCLSLVLVHISAYFGLLRLRTSFKGITLMCILISPFLYVFRLQGVKEGMKRVCCKCSAKVGLSDA